MSCVGARKIEMFGKGERERERERRATHTRRARKEEKRGEKKERNRQMILQIYASDALVPPSV